MQVRKISLITIAAILPLVVYSLKVQTAKGAQAAAKTNAPPAQVQPEYMETSLPEADRAYGTIDGKHIWQYVKEQAAIAEQYRDQGHPQFWGRIAGTSGDVADAQWLLDKFK